MNRIPVILLLLTLALGCAAPEPAPPPAPTPSAAPPPPAIEVQEPSADRPLVIFLGDSLTAGLGLAEEQAFPNLVARQLAADGKEVRLVNAGSSGDTTAGGLARLDWLLGQKPDVLVVCLGANDGLRGLPLDQTEENLRQIIRRAQAAGARVLLLGMLVPPNYGPDYARSFAAIYPQLAQELGVPLMPFLLEDVAAVPELNQADGIHPSARGQEILAENVLPWLRPLLEE